MGKILDIDIKMIDTHEQLKYKAEQLINTIQLQADFFEMSTRIKPTIFMSYDLLHLIAAGARDTLSLCIDKTETPYTICGYDVEVLYNRSKLLYMGYKCYFNAE